MSGGQKILILAATGLGVGFVPVAPGTLGTLVGMGPAWLLSGLSFWPALLVLVTFTVLAIGIAGRAATILGQKDPGCIVIDEIAGVMVACWGLPGTLPVMLAGFLTFRCLDIAKPFFIRTVEKKLSGGTGIVLDDVLAGLMANVLLRLFLG